MNLLIQTLASVAMAIGGMLIIAWYNGIQSPYTGPFSLKIFWQDNGIPFLYSVFGIATIFSLIAVAPDVTDWIKTISGWEIKMPITNGGAVFLGGMIYDQVRKSNRFKNPQQ